MKILVIKKRTLFIAIAVILILSAILGIVLKCASVFASAPSMQKTIVIDAGHGGWDYGVIGKDGLKESEFNLIMAKELCQLLKDSGFKVVMTRKTDEGLYKENDKNRKRADMEERKRIIRKSNPDIVISIHANKYPSRSRRGAQVFFDEFNSDGKILAESIQSNLNILNMAYVERNFSALKGDYYLLKCCSAPSVIVECGFLSNPEDEKLLSDSKYRNEMTFCIYSGIVGYFETA